MYSKLWDNINHKGGSMEIKETKEVLIALNEVTLVIAEALKDGFDASEDLMIVLNKLLLDEVFKAKIEAAFENISAVGDEIKDIDLNEGIELALVQIGYLPRLLDAFNKE